MKRLESTTFRKWLEGIKDPITKARIVTRIDRMMCGHLGDVEPIGKGLSELRMHFGAGYRVYFYQEKDVLVLLLSGGDKSSQSKDIERAHRIFNEWKESQHD